MCLLWIAKAWKGQNVWKGHYSSFRLLRKKNISMLEYLNISMHPWQTVFIFRGSRWSSTPPFPLSHIWLHSRAILEYLKCTRFCQLQVLDVFLVCWGWKVVGGLHTRRCVTRAAGWKHKDIVFSDQTPFIVTQQHSCLAFLSHHCCVKGFFFLLLLEEEKVWKQARDCFFFFNLLNVVSGARFWFWKTNHRAVKLQIRNKQDNVTVKATTRKLPPI